MKKAGLMIMVGIATVGTLVGDLLPLKSLELASKPLLMPLMIALLWVEIDKPISRYVKWFIGAFVFSWLGDIFLMLPSTESEQAKLFFLAGLGSFLVSHVLFIVSYTQSVTVTEKKGYLPLRIGWVLPVILYGGIFYGILYNHIPDLFMKVAVGVYSSAIMGMVISAMRRKGVVEKSSFELVLAGAILFVLSDSCIGITVFIKPFEGSSALIMLFYIAAQYLMMRGIVKQSKRQTL